MFLLSCDVMPFPRLFICALCLPAEKGLTSWLSFVVSYWYPGSVVVLDFIDS